MHRSNSFKLLVLGVALAGASPQGRADPVSLDTSPQYINGRLVLPAWETTWERRAVLQKDTAADVNTYRSSQPGLYAVSEAPLQPVRHYAEYDPVDAVYFAWEAGLFDAFFAGIAQALLTHTTVEIVLLHHGPTERQDVEAEMVVQGLDPADVTFLDVATLGPYYVWQSETPFDRSLESFWTVDYGPFFVEDGAGVLGVVDPRYYTKRVNDDAVPTKVASALGVTTFRPDISHEGGNFFSDGRGTCFSTGLAVADNAPQSQADLEALLTAYYGCTKTIWLWPLYGEPTGHIDMFFKNASATTVLLGRYDPLVDPDNAVLLDANAALLAAETNADGSPFQILRLDMPDNSDGVWRTYLNGIVVNDLVLVPTYAGHTTHEASALATLGQAFPGRTVIGLDSEDIMQWGGAIHCVTRSRPVATHAPLTAPADACGGDYDCVQGCGNITTTGECIYGYPVFCDAGELQTAFCASNERCGWLLGGGYFDCVLPNCGTLDPGGECRRPTGWDEVVVTCSASGYPQGERCPPGTLCDDSGATAGCVACTTNECNLGESGCDTDGNAWHCGLFEFGDNCLQVLVDECESDEQCVAGVCECVDQCALGDVGCDAEGRPWTCGEADDLDDCLEPVADVPCRTEETCVAGVCECEDQCTLGEQGCDTDGNAWTCGEAADGDDCLDRVVTACSLGTECQDATCVLDVSTDNGCGCNHSGGGGTVLVWLLLGLFGFRLRRRGGTP